MTDITTPRRNSIRVPGAPAVFAAAKAFINHTDEHGNR